MFSKLTEKDFLVLRGPFESGRQSPVSLGSAMILAIFGQALLVFLSFFIGNYSVLPFTDTLVAIHFWITVVIVALTIVYSFPYFYKNHQKSQYLLSVFTAQNLFTLSPYILILLTMGAKLPEDYILEHIVIFIYITAGVGVILFIATCIRFYILLMKGAYRKGSSRDRLRGKFEGKINMASIGAGSIGVVASVQYLMRNVDFMDYEVLFIIAIFLLIFYTMIFILPEQLVILYCKYRFKSFNFRPSGKYLTLIPLQETDKDEKNA
ncbi:hypothetical protein [Halalkalibacter hemicellulosilyticus]|uniref:ABC transporter ATPase n=1 Tax=Halalkalibacter hemicellulosilyticusJCM 9152 TaxID=1236971 RepID=W4QL53_9BACI|nr:hypothetical protein [Halalkalibacter hemicellulosilyticus]GAE32069.1 hypothetical protein JCM9152_3585 [Halalkalibacter hemicellulosilyticusJCM 9152]